MSPDTPREALTRQDYPEAAVLRIGLRELRDGEQLAALMEALSREAEAGDRPLILDLAAVEFLDSAALGRFITLRARLHRRGRPFQDPHRRAWALFALFADVAAALAAVRQGEPDPLLLSGVRPGVEELFRYVR